MFGCGTAKWKLPPAWGETTDGLMLRGLSAVWLLGRVEYLTGDIGPTATTGDRPAPSSAGCCVHWEGVIGKAVVGARGRTLVGGAVVLLTTGRGYKATSGAALIDRKAFTPSSLGDISGWQELDEPGGSCEKCECLEEALEDNASLGDSL